jgi:hypothetical protein
MANSIAYVLSKNTYPDAFQANLIGVHQGTQIVYTTTSTLSSSNILYIDSRLTQPFYGDPTAWYGVQLLTSDSVKYALTISANGSITTNPGTTTTTSAPTTTTTGAPTTTTTTSGVSSYTITSVGGKSPSCTISGSTQTVYASSNNINSISAFFTNSSLTIPFNGTLEYYVYTNGVNTASAQVDSSGILYNAVPC